MPASSEARGRWRKRKREYPSGRKSRLREPENDDAFEENEEDDDPDLDPPQNNAESPQIHGQDVKNPVSRERETEKLADGAVTLCEFPTAVKRAVIRPHSSVLAIVEAEKSAQFGYSKSPNLGVFPLLENISHGQLQALSAVPRNSPSLPGAPSEEASSSGGSYVIKPPNITPGHGVIKRLGSAGRVHVLPSHSEWFSLNTVHRLERQVVPHFFCGKSAENTPEKYMECRNFIVAKYMENPENHLTVHDCQGLVSGIEIDDLNRIVRFLDHWGIINYCAAPLANEAQNDRKYLFEDSNGELRVPSAALKSIESLIRFNRPKCCLKAIDAYLGIANQHDEDFDYNSTISERLSENHCSLCFRSLDAVYYQSNKEVDVQLCHDCFHEGRFVPGHSSLDFVKGNSVKDYGDGDGENWSDEETLLLLEGVRLYNDNWSKIAEHVGTKSKPQCILQFVRLPLDGVSFENIDNTRSTFGPSNSRDREGREKPHPHSNGFGVPEESGSESDFPFENLENPVVGLVSFVASALGPRVAAACSHASLASLCKNYDKEVNPHEDAITTNTKEGNCGPLSSQKVVDAAYDGLAAASVKAKLFADHEEREIQRLAANIVNQQLKRLELKLKQIAEIETLLMKECEQIERTRQRFTSQRALMASSPQYSSPVMMNSPRPTNPQSFSNAMAANRPQISGFQQPFYGSNQQQIHPHLSLMHQPGMYGLSPRLPISSPQQPSSSSSFGPQQNSQSSLGHPLLR